MSKDFKIINKKLEAFVLAYDEIVSYDTNIKFENFNNISTDSRHINQNDLFIALNGENFKGHEFVPDVIKKGASFFVTEKETGQPKQILVKSTLNFIQDLATYILKDIKELKIFGITGTNGKTTTKEILTNILKEHFNVLATKGNLNNQIGLPLTIFNLKNTDQILVLEMGTNSKGEIEKLAKIARPQFGAITNIGKGHTEGLVDKENIFLEKSNIVKYFNSDSVFAFNMDDEFINMFFSKFKYKKISYGIKNKADIRAENIQEGYSKFNLIYRNNKYPVSLKAPGINNIYNALCSASLAIQSGLDMELIVKGVESFEGINNRFKIIELPNENIIINDTYNANPDSTIRAIEMTNKIFPEKKRVAILGSMLELGETSSLEHTKIGEYLNNNEFTEFYCFGNNSLDYKKNLSSNIKFVEITDHSEIKKYIDLNSIKNTVILVKGSRGMKMERIFTSLGL
tara:strand:- start:11661 stop:13034 length:1374 start_codon:yes stop_codon:yes gene_type:complete